MAPAPATPHRIVALTLLMALVGTAGFAEASPPSFCDNHPTHKYCDSSTGATEWCYKGTTHPHCEQPSETLRFEADCTHQLGLTYSPIEPWVPDGLEPVSILGAFPLSIHVITCDNATLAFTAVVVDITNSSLEDPMMESPGEPLYTSELLADSSIFDVMGYAPRIVEIQHHALGSSIDGFDVLYHEPLPQAVRYSEVSQLFVGPDLHDLKWQSLIHDGSHAYTLVMPEGTWDHDITAAAAGQYHGIQAFESLSS